MINARKIRPSTMAVQSEHERLFWDGLKEGPQICQYEVNKLQSLLMLQSQDNIKSFHHDSRNLGPYL